ncbi:MAG: MFS transporter [Thermoplasmata archaeon]|nr:MFS transporter [Thermoplasmata archaeon]
MDWTETERPSPAWASFLARPWLLAFLPINAATAAFGLSLQLLILKAQGSVIEWALAATLFNGALIVSSIIWGYLADRYPLRRGFLLINYIGFAAIYAALYQLTSFNELILLYTLVGVLTPAGVSASNLLILEQFSEGERPTAFASFQEISILGSIVGGLVGFFWLQANELLRPLLIVLAAFALASAIIVWWGVKDSPKPLTSHSTTLDAASLVSRLRHSVALRSAVPFFPPFPQFQPGVVHRAWRRVREEARHELPLIFAASLLFNLSANLFNVSYTFYLSAVGISFAGIFLVNVSNNAAQGVLFPLSGSLSTRGGADRLVRTSSLLRCVGYLIVVAFTFDHMFGGALAFGANILVYAIMGGAIALYSTASSLVLFRTLHERDAGSMLGLNSALGGVAAIGGAFLSGILSYYGSYRLTFLVAAVGLLISLPLWAAADAAYIHRQVGPVAPPAPS